MPRPLFEAEPRNLADIVSRGAAVPVVSLIYFQLLRNYFNRLRRSKCFCRFALKVAGVDLKKK